MKKEIITNYKVYDLEETLVASGYAMIEEYSEKTVKKEALDSIDAYINNEEDYSRHLKRALKLAKAPLNSGHVSFAKGIVVNMDITFTNKAWIEFQRYHFADIVTSSSKMHRLCKMNIANACNKYVSNETIEQMEKLVDRYNYAVEKGAEEGVIYENFMKMISNCPMGLELFERVSTNYKQLQTIYNQRKNHRLKEDWGAFCKMIEELPYFEELIKGQ